MNPILKNSKCLYEGGGKIGDILTLNCIPVLLEGFVRWALIFAGLVAVIFVILGGIKLITSSGDTKQVEAARKTITWAMLGLALILMSFAIVRFVGAITGVNCINQFGFDVCGYNPGQSRGSCVRNPNQPGC